MTIITAVRVPVRQRYGIRSLQAVLLQRKLGYNYLNTLSGISVVCRALVEGQDEADDPVQSVSVCGTSTSLPHIPWTLPNKETVINVAFDTWEISSAGSSKSLAFARGSLVSS